MKPQAAQRIDPKPRPTNGVHTSTLLKDKDPNKKYVWVNLADSNALSTYEALGYIVEEQRDGGPHHMGGKLNRKNGERIEWRGNLLMSISLERAMEIEKYGPDGDSGQDLADKIEGRYLEKDRGRDPMRGIGLLNRLTPSYLEFEADKGHNAPVIVDRGSENG